MIIRLSMCRNTLEPSRIILRNLRILRKSLQTLTYNGIIILVVYTTIPFIYERR